MIRLAANISFMFPELPFLDRIDAAARAGFATIEFAWGYDIPLPRLVARCRDAGVAFSLINTPPGYTSAGDFGLGAVPGREAEMREGVELALLYAEALSVPRIHVVAGNVPPGIDRALMRKTYIANLKWAEKRAAERGIGLLIEPLNSRDRPNFFLQNCAQAIDIIEEVNRPGLKLQLDFYHYWLTEGDPFDRLADLLPWAGHIQISGVPNRQEPDETSELDYGRLLPELDRLGYQGFIGCEYAPRGDTVAGLGWAKEYLCRSGE